MTDEILQPTGCVPTSVNTTVIDCCHCGAVGDEGHTLDCIMKAIKHRKQQSLITTGLSPVIIDVVDVSV